MNLSKLKIEVVDLCFSYPGSQDRVLNNVNCSIPAGQITALIGPSASGKSTLGKVLKGFYEPTSGKIGFGDQNGVVTEYNARARLKTIGWAGAHPEVQIFAPTVWEEVGFAPSNQGLKGIDLEQRIVTALEQVGLNPGDFQNRPPLSLSGGEKRRIALAGVIAMGCQWYIFDEPTAGLDYKGCKQIIDLAEKLKQQNCGLLWISLGTDIINCVADQIIEMKSGTTISQTI